MNVYNCTSITIKIYLTYVVAVKVVFITLKNLTQLVVLSFGASTHKLM